jgi:class 3 adenylate cyclase
MEITGTRRLKLKQVANESLDLAELRWSHAETLLEKAAALAFKDSVSASKATIETPYPGVSSVETERPTVKYYFVLVADLRDSTTHLQTDPPQDANVSGPLHRLYLETSALLPTLAYHIRTEGGRVTEFLGDGVLAFTEVLDMSSSREFAKSVRLGEECLAVCNDIINPILWSRYNIPELEIGVGLSVGQAIITAMGLNEDARAIAFGEPVFEASKMSKARNQVALSGTMRRRWPKGKGGKRQFKAFNVRNDDVGYKTWLKDE